jgi:long-chain acyl-CoA synthetase
MEEKPWYDHYDHTVPKSMRFPRIPYQALLGNCANAFPDKPALSFYGAVTTYWELRDMSIRMANIMAGLGVEKGDRIGIHLANMPQYPIMQFAALHLGAIVVNFNPLYTPDELTALVKLTEPRVIVTFDNYMLNIAEVCKTVDIPVVIGTSIFDYMNGTETSTAESLKMDKSWYHFSELLDNCQDITLPKVDISPEDPAMIQFTGGTTGIPKGATLTHGNMIAGAMITAEWGSATISFILPERRSVMVALPLFHVYANIVAMGWALTNAATMYLVPRFEADSFMDLMAGIDNITFFPAVPTMINAIVNHPRAKEVNLARRIDLMNSGGGPMPVELIDKVKSLGIPYTEGFGMSETTSIGISNPNLGRKKDGSIGIPMIGMDVKLIDLEGGGALVPQGEPGELCIKGPVVMKEYWKNPQKTAEELKDGWLYTGDIARADEDGYLYIVDRKKDMVIAGGYNIYPRDIDEVLYQHPKIMDAVSIGVNDEYRGETIKAFVVLNSGETATEEEIIQFCKQKLAVYKVPKIIEFREELPKSAVGKILRKTLRDEEEAK